MRTILMTALMLSQLVAAAPPPVPLDAGTLRPSAPRATAYCIALLESSDGRTLSTNDLLKHSINRWVGRLNRLREDAESPPTVARQIGRALRRLFTLDPARVNLPRTIEVRATPAAERLIDHAYARLDRTRRDLLHLPESRVPVRRVVRGQDAVRAYLGELRARALTVQRELTQTAPADPRPRLSPVYPGKILSTVGVLSVQLGFASLWTLGTLHLAGHHHLKLAAVSPMVYSWLFGRGLVARIDRLYLNTLGAARAVARRPRPEAPADFANDALALHQDILEALDNPPDAEGLIYAGTTVELPLRQWDSYRALGSPAAARRPPNAPELRAAVSKHGWRPPVDARRYQVDLLFYRDPDDGVPTLISVMHEAPYLSDH